MKIGELKEIFNSFTVTTMVGMLRNCKWTINDKARTFWDRKPRKNKNTEPGHDLTCSHKKGKIQPKMFCLISNTVCSKKIVESSWNHILFMSRLFLHNHWQTQICNNVVAMMLHRRYEKNFKSQFRKYNCTGRDIFRTQSNTYDGG